jgi:hypothetical protein
MVESGRMRLRRRTPLVAALLAVAALGTLASVAAASSERRTVDVYVTGKVTAGVPGKNASRVEVRWDFKCLGDKLGEATYEWTLVASTIGAASPRTVTLQKGTSKSGRLTTVLTPGRWQLRADPFLCETERGAGSTSPEVGQVVDVPDRCAWLVTRARGVVEADAGAVVRRARVGASLTPATVVTTPAGASIDLKTAGGEASLALAGGSRLVVDRATCGGGPKATISAGSVKATAREALEVSAGAARSTGRAATWSVTAAGGKATIAVAKGTVTVKGRTGGAVLVKAGQRTTVVGRNAPTSP